MRQAGSWTGNRDLERALPALVEPLRRSLRDALRSHRRPGAATSWSSSSRRTCSASWPTASSRTPTDSARSTTSTTANGCSATGSTRRRWSRRSCAGMYDLVFGYEGGDPARPRFSAGLGLQLATKMLLGYSGALFWKMQAGMGEVIFAPLYEVLRARGVEFRFFHRVDALRLADDGRSIAAIDLGLQAELADGVDAYDPLFRVKGLPCWPDAPFGSQLRTAERPRRGRPRVVLVARAATSVAARSRRARTSTPSCSRSPSAWCRTCAATSWRRPRPGGRWSSKSGRWPRRRSSSGCPRTSGPSGGPAPRASR